MQNTDRLLACLASLAVILFGTGVQAQPTQRPYPVQPIRMVVPFAAGGATDVVARQIANDMSNTLGQPVIVDNRPGASGATGTEAVMRSAPDGYTLQIGVTTTHGINPALNPKLRYSAIKDFTPISLVATMPHVLVVSGDSPIHSLADFVRAAKAARPSFAFGSAGEGSPQHLAGEILKTMFGFDAIHVPYKGGGPALVDLMGGQTQFMSTGLSEVSSLLASGKVRGLAVASQRRIDGLDVPTFSELGRPFELTAWYAIFAPAKMQPELVTRINAAVVKATRSTELRDSFAKLNMTPVGSTPEELALYVAAESRRWSAAVQAAGIKPQE